MMSHYAFFSTTMKTDLRTQESSELPISYLQAVPNTASSRQRTISDSQEDFLWPVGDGTQDKMSGSTVQLQGPLP